MPGGCPWLVESLRDERGLARTLFAASLTLRRNRGVLRRREDEGITKLQTR